jgi:ABC-type polysaccharide/polyol phosphate transport system ATPase subunit
MSSEIAIKIENLSKAYQIYDQPRDRLKQFVLPRMQRLVRIPAKNYFREYSALEDVSFEISRGETVAIVGRNGCGKSTLLQIICGTLSQTHGTVETNGRIAAMLELGSGFNPEFTGIENVYLYGSILGLSKHDIDQRFDRIAAFADIGEFIQQPVKTYSSGMYVRLAFAAAIHSDPEILVIDEALAVGDFLFQQKCINHLKNELKHVTKLLVTHDMGAVTNMADRAILMRKGKVVCLGDPKNIVEQYYVISRNDEKSILTHSEVIEENKEQVSVFNDPEFDITKVDMADWHPIDIGKLSGTLRSKFSNFVWQINNATDLKQVRPGDKVTISALVDCTSNIEEPIIGYQIQNLYGVVVFGENTVSSGLSLSKIVEGKFIIKIEFHWPEVENSDYSVTIGVGAGADSHQHIIECWAHNIFSLKSVTSSPVHGIFNQKVDKVDVFQI